MCLDIDYSDHILLGYGTHKARKEHKCEECRRVIEPGETYHYWTQKDIEYNDGVTTNKMCAHCHAVIDVGCAITDCPPAWYWGMVLDRGDDGGFIGDILTHDLLITAAGKWAMIRYSVRGKLKQWRKPDGTLYPVPAMHPSFRKAA